MYGPSPDCRAGEPIALTPAQARLRKMVLDAVPSAHSKCNYAKALDDPFQFCASRPLSRSLLMEWRVAMESLSPSTINVRLSAVRKLVSEARRNSSNHIRNTGFTVDNCTIRRLYGQLDKFRVADIENPQMAQELDGTRRKAAGIPVLDLYRLPKTSKPESSEHAESWLYGVCGFLSKYSGQQLTRCRDVNEMHYASNWTRVGTRFMEDVLVLAPTRWKLNRATTV